MNRDRARRFEMLAADARIDDEADLVHRHARFFEGRRPARVAALTNDTPRASDGVRRCQRRTRADQAGSQLAHKAEKTLVDLI